MGELLRRKEQWSRAVEIYSEVLGVDPEFPEAHTKLGFILYSMENSDGALHEARTALSQNPEDAEARKIAGLALDNEQKFDAAVAEYREACRNSVEVECFKSYEIVYSLAGEYSAKWHRPITELRVQSQSILSEHASKLKLTPDILSERACRGGGLSGEGPLDLAISLCLCDLRYIY